MPTANVNLLKDLDILAPFGTVVIVGSRGEITFNPRAIFGKNAVVTGVNTISMSSEEFKETFAAINAGLSVKTLVPQVGRSFPLTAAAEAHVEVIAQSAGSAGKIVMHPW